jgi:ADP-ribose pyrophosphatase YjhB (NUDIX family)
VTVEPLVEIPGFELIARAVVTDGPRVLLAQPSGDGWFFLPGGHVELGESVTAALRRELTEELGVADARVGGLLAVTETKYHDARGHHHEVNLVFHVEATGVEDRSQEAHIDFRWVDRSALDDLEIRPAPIAEVLGSSLHAPRLQLLSEGFDIVQEP